MEALPFGLLVFVVGSLLVANAWAVVDAKFATDAAAREAARRYVEATDPDTATAEALEAARGALDGRGRRHGSVAPVGDVALTRCRPATFEAVVVVPALSLPWIGGFGDGFEVRSRHTEVVDPFRAGLAGPVRC